MDAFIVVGNSSFDSYALFQLTLEDAIKKYEHIPRNVVTEAHRQATQMYFVKPVIEKKKKK